MYINVEYLMLNFLIDSDISTLVYIIVFIIMFFFFLQYPAQSGTITSVKAYFEGKGFDDMVNVSIQVILYKANAMNCRITGKFGGLKYWRSLIWQHGTVASYVHGKEGILVEFNFAVGWLIRQTAKFNTAPNFPVISLWYATMKYIRNWYCFSCFIGRCAQELTF